MPVPVLRRVPVVAVVRRRLMIVLVVRVDVLIFVSLHVQWHWNHLNHPSDVQARRDSTRTNKQGGKRERGSGDQYHSNNKQTDKENTQAR